jgi:hypothetical protein
MERARAMPVPSGTAWVAGRCAILLQTLEGRPETISIYVLEEPRSGVLRDAPPLSKTFTYECDETHPFVAAKSIMRWVRSLEGD